MSWPRIRNGAREFVDILVEAGRAWSRDNGSRMAAALAFYAAFSIAPLLLLGMGVAGVVFDEQLVRAELTTHMQEFVGPRIEEYVWGVVDRWQDRGAGLQASIVALVALGWGSFRGFDALRATLNMMWDVEKRHGTGISGRLLRRAGTFAMMVCVGVLTVASVTFSTIFTRATTRLEQWMGLSLSALRRIETIGSLVLLVVLFALIFKWAANVEIHWRDAVAGALFTAFVFVIGRILIELILTHVTTTSVFGAAGALVALLAWVYMSAMIFFFGAEVTEVWARRNGRRIRPDSTAVRVARLQRVRDAIREALGDDAVDAVDRQLGFDDQPTDTAPDSSD